MIRGDTSKSDVRPNIESLKADHARCGLGYTQVTKLLEYVVECEASLAATVKDGHSVYWRLREVVSEQTVRAERAEAENAVLRAALAEGYRIVNLEAYPNAHAMSSQLRKALWRLHGLLGSAPAPPIAPQESECTSTTCSMADECERGRVIKP